MNFTEEIVKARCDKIITILGHKAQEYATGRDRFHNFNVAAKMLDTTPEKALLGMMMKHVVSVFDLIEWAENQREKLSVEIIDEKIGDNINYLILLEGLLKKRLKEPKKLGECIKKMEKQCTTPMSSR